MYSVESSKVSVFPYEEMDCSTFEMDKSVKIVDATIYISVKLGD